MQLDIAAGGTLEFLLITTVYSISSPPSSSEPPPSESRTALSSPRQENSASSSSGVAFKAQLSASCDFTSSCFEGLLTLLSSGFSTAAAAVIGFGNDLSGALLEGLSLF